MWQWQCIRNGNHVDTAHDAGQPEETASSKVTERWHFKMLNPCEYSTNQASTRTCLHAATHLRHSTICL